MLDSLFIRGSVELPAVLIDMGLSMVLGVISAYFYQRKERASRGFVLALAALPLIVSTVIMVVNGNLGAGIAVAGSFSLIRFRSAQGTAREITAVFLSAAMGLCLGAGYWLVACLLLCAYILFTLCLELLHFGEGRAQERELKISVPEALDYEGIFDDLLKESFESYDLERVRTVEMGTVYQLIYRVTLKENAKQKDILDQIRVRNGNLPVSLGRIPDRPNAM
ncbi:MAG: DUF4956 domain-containing protein [Clostridia bacterium]|nr:DUF4956 domain-containing protein [Clostridia bacterium]